MAELDDLSYGILDLYEKVILLLKAHVESAPAMMAFVKAMEECDPRFQAAYARHLEAARKQKPFQETAALLPLLEKAVQTLRNRLG